MRNRVSPSLPNGLKSVVQLFLSLLLFLPLLASAQTRILCIGDSITEGASSFTVYRPALAKKLSDAGISATFVGPKKDRDGLSHAGYGGRSIEGVAAEFGKFHEQFPADVLLIHSGHNHSVEEKPIPGIIRSYESLITLARKDNPNLIVLLAKVIPSGKLPKYEYIPALNVEIEALGNRLNTPEQPVIVVDQAAGFDWKTDTIQDMVHPNAAGAEKMAAKWFDALKPVLASKPQVTAEIPAEIAALPEDQKLALAQETKVLTYKNVDGTELEMHVFLPKEPADGKLRPAILYIHGGGWVGGDPSICAFESLYLSRQGIVTATIRYRLLGKGPNKAKSPADCLADAKSAMRFFRAHAKEFSIDPNRIAAGGGSAGAHLAAALNTVKGYDDPKDDLAVSCEANALVLLYPAFDLTGGWGSGITQCKKAGIDPATFSPATLADEKFPPTLILVGREDPVSPVASNAAFAERMKKLGRPVEIFTYAGKEHKLFDRRKSDPHFQSYLIHSSRFFQELGWIEKRPLPPLPAIEFTSVKVP